MSLDVNISEPDEFNCNELHSCIDVVAKLKGLEDFVYHVDFICGNGENLIANVFRILIKDVQSEDKQYSFIVKTLINTARQELFHELHIREVNAYEMIVKKYEIIQESLDIEQRIVFPKCEYTRIEKNQEVIILEDMKAKGYQTDTKLANYERLDYTQVSTAIKELAKFHALSFIYEKQDSQTFENIKSKFQDIIFTERFLNKSKLRNYFHESYGMSLNLVEDLKAKKKLEMIQLRLLELLKLYTRPGKSNVLCHGDYWINNIMFKNDENNETKVCFIDFQVMRFSSPLTDILHFLFLCTDSAFRTAYFDDLMIDYYDSLKAFLNAYSIDINSVYTKEDFDDDCKTFLPFGFLLAMIELRILTTTPEDEAISKGSNIVPGIHISEVPGELVYYKMRVNDVVKECVNNGVLDRVVDKLSSL
ncbi:putative Juvenile hormone-inducible protein [Operophtera brumata]|uniref:Putative Juvenile hormone-inducible protein n=1 Tax=Operophtera brumata TaxID=104452 RepID=A0A0L7LQZ0_OPEBR|nr:putative Juvenile hormone-inducible protein [Operophtera brumata]